jgi:DNA-binding transcriptional LysR family regulator
MGRVASAVEELVRSERTRVRLAVPSGFTRFFAAGLPALRRERPGLELELVSGSRPVDLGRGEADLAIRSGPVSDPELVVRKLVDSAFSLYASESYLARRPAPRDLDDLAGHELVGFDKGLAAVPAARWIEAHAPPATIVLRSREMTDMVTAAASGVGIAALPCSLGDLEPGLRRLTPEVVGVRPLSLVYRREARLSDEVRAVIRFVIATIREHADLIRGTARRSR